MTCKPCSSVSLEMGRGPRFGGALDDAARMFCDAYEQKLSPEAFVEKCKREKTAGLSFAKL